MRAEISYDLALEDEMDFLEGTYRLPKGNWQVFIVTAFDRDITNVQVVPHRWDNGATGVLVKMPRTEPISAIAVERALATSLSVSEWVRVHGPDSMQLR